MFYGAVLNAGEYIGKPSYRIYVPQAACSQQRIDDGRMVCRLVVAAEKVVLGKYPLIPTLWMIFEDSTFAFRSGDKHRSRRIYGK